MNQTMIQIPLSGLIIVLIVIVGIIISLISRISNLSKNDNKTEDILLPFSDPRPGPDPIPPVMTPSNPVVPVWDPKVKPARFAYDQTVFERFYVPYHGQIEEIMVSVNDEVKKGDILMRVKCADTQCEVKASANGRIRELNCKTGELFGKDALLYVIQ